MSLDHIAIVTFGSQHYYILLSLLLAQPARGLGV